MKFSMNKTIPWAERRIFSVTKLTQKIKGLLEDSYPFVWVAGEISNFHRPVSGHYYFNLKDPGAQINAVMFRAQNLNLKFRPEDGMAVVAMGRLNVYEPKGIYQIIIEYLEPEGIGVLQLAFEQLKARLATDGLFDEKHKRPLPFLPQKIAVVTSPTGAVIRDIIHVINRRFPNVALDIAPVKVQGKEAAEEIVQALELLNQMDEADVIVLARGGGSLEDLQAFNSEIVARAIFSSHIPVVSAVGHETDFTIADFTADVRAPTPSTAAEIVLPVKEELLKRIQETRSAAKSVMLQRVRLLKERSVQLLKRLVHPGRQIADYRLRIDDALARILRGLSRQLDEKRVRLNMIQERLDRNSPLSIIEDLNVLLNYHHQSLRSALQFYLQLNSGALRTTVAKLNALNPLAILERGYSVTQTLPDYALVKDVQQVSLGQRVKVNVSRGAMVCRIERKRENGKTNI